MNSEPTVVAPSSSERRGPLRIVDAVLKAAVATPLLALLVLWLRATVTGEQGLYLTDLQNLTCILIVIGYSFWSAFAVWTRRRRPEHTAYWALGAAIIWIVAVPGHLQMMKKAQKASHVVIRTEK